MAAPSRSAATVQIKPKAPENKKLQSTQIKHCLKEKHHPPVKTVQEQ